MDQPARRSLVRIPLLLTVLLLVGLVAPAGVATAANGKGGKNPGFYENPLLPVIPGGGLVESCADPIVIQDQDRDAGEPITWYMYCTTDPLNDEDVNAAGDPIFHRIPMMTSQDLVNWTYVGDAFAQGTEDLPSYAAPGARLWAPDVVYSSTFGKYYMFFVVTDTTATGCDNDSAIGVATSASPTGPWVVSDEMVIAPRHSGRAGACDFLWTFDPDVLGDTIGTQGVLYYGSYVGGIFATGITLTPTGAVADAAPDVMITIDNRYEGANVVYNEETGYYYLFVSATNCCNGALTGYAVFVGRSISPYGPFVDQYGNEFTDAQVGGTPFLFGNGNEWTGTGHNTVFQDANGDWWTIYHAVDQNDPFYEFAPGFTKRPALLDAIDWVNGWPTVNGGSGPSSRKMPAPAGQEGEVSRHKTRLVATQAPHRLLSAYSDEFNDSNLDGWTWDWTGENNDPPLPAPPLPDYTVDDGVLRVEIQHGDTYVDVDNAYVLVRDAPEGDYVVETRLRTDIPDEGCCFNYSQAGIGIYGDEDNLVKLTETSIWNTRQTEWAKEIGEEDAAEGWSRYGNSVVGPPSAHNDPADQGDGWTYLRIVVEELGGAERAAAGGDTHSYTGYTSQNGVNWVRGQTWTHTLGDAEQIALFFMGSTEAGQQWTAEFDYVRVYSLKETRGGAKR